MKIWLIRGATLSGLLVLLWVLHFFLAPMGLAWVVYTLLGAIGLFLVVELGLRSRKRAGERADWARWRASLHEAGARRRSIAELRRGIDRARRFGGRQRIRHARLATVMAELQLAEGHGEGAIATLAKVPVSDLEPLQAAIVRQARAQAYLHAGDHEGAASTLSPIDRPLGDAVLDAAVELARGAVALGEGRLDEAEAAAEGVSARAEEHDELWDEARALLAACLDVRGETERSRAVLDGLEARGRARLALVGSHAVRALLAAADPRRVSDEP